MDLEIHSNMEGGEFLGESLERGLGGPARRGGVKKGVVGSKTWGYARF